MSEKLFLTTVEIYCRVKELEEPVPIKVVKVSSNDTRPLVYLPADICRTLRIRKGDRLLLFLDLKHQQFLARKVADAKQLPKG